MDIIRTKEKVLVHKLLQIWQQPVTVMTNSRSRTSHPAPAKTSMSLNLEPLALPTKRSSLTQGLNEMTEQTERLSATSSGNEEVDYVGNVDVKVDDLKVDHDVELSEGETF